MALVARQAGHSGALSSSSISPRALSNSDSPHCTPCCSAVQSSASSAASTSGLTYANTSLLTLSNRGKRGRRQPERMEWFCGAWSVSCARVCRDNVCRRVFLDFPSFEEVPLLQRHLPVVVPPLAQFASSCAQASRKLPRPSDEVFATVNCLAHRQSIGTFGPHIWASQRSRGNKSDDSGNISEEETKGGEADGKGEDKVEELNQEGEEAQGSGPNDTRQKGEGDKANGKEPSSVQNEGIKTVLWRKIWGPGQSVDEELLDPEEELMLQDLESLRFNWKALLDPTWENVLALGFTTLLTLALIKILSQLVIVVMTILVAALKYTVLAAFLLGLLIFLL